MAQECKGLFFIFDNSGNSFTTSSVLTNNRLTYHTPNHSLPMNFIGMLTERTVVVVLSR